MEDNYFIGIACFFPLKCITKYKLIKPMPLALARHVLFTYHLLKWKERVWRFLKLVDKFWLTLAKILSNRLVLNFILASFYQNYVLFDYSIKISRFMPILGFCADAFRVACNWYCLPTLGSGKWLQGGMDSGDWNLKFKSLHFHNINNQ